LTLILPKKACIPDLVTAGLNTVAVRIPSHNVARSLIKTTGLPIAAPSANKSGRPSPTKAEHVQADFIGQIPLIIDSGAVEIGVESTVLDLSGKKPLILRPGKIGVKELAPILGPVVYAENVTEKPAAPGMKYVHYAPKAQIILARTEELAALWRKEKEKGHDPLVLCFADSAKFLPSGAKSLILADDGDLEGYAHELFAAFRLGDVLGYPCLLVETVMEESGLGIAIMNRLQKAAGKKKSEQRYPGS
jgi:L-threonylcarbamoyladenylate synthase